MADEFKPLHANAEKTAIVPEGSPEARYIVNPNDPGEFRELVDAHREKATRKSAAPAADKAQDPGEDKAVRAAEDKSAASRKGK